MKKIKTIACIAGMMMASAISAQVNQQILGEKHAMLRIDSQKKYLLRSCEALRRFHRASSHPRF